MCRSTAMTTPNMSDHELKNLDFVSHVSSTDYSPLKATYIMSCHTRELTTLSSLECPSNKTCIRGHGLTSLLREVRKIKISSSLLVSLIIESKFFKQKQKWCATPQTYYI